MDDEEKLKNENVERVSRKKAKPASSDAPKNSGSPANLDDFEGFIEPETDQRAWYVIHCYSGYENKVRHNLEQRIDTMGMKDKIFDVVIPTQEEIEVKEGKRRTIERHVFPGYVLVNMVLTEESWYVVRNTPGVTGFVGMGNSPTALRPEEVSQILKRMEAEAPHIKVTFKQGERVRIVDGPFNDHAFLEPECSVAYLTPEGRMEVRVGSQIDLQNAAVAVQVRVAARKRVD